MAEAGQTPKLGADSVGAVTEQIGGWRIDDLARRSGTTVDTIRFYQREGLLPPAERHGRSLLYGPAHLERLERIRDLQARHFSLKAIRSLAEEGRLQLLDQLFKPESVAYTREQLQAESGLDPALFEDLEAAGLIGPPERHGALSYDAEDLGVLVTLRESMARGTPRSVVVVLARTVRGAMAELERQWYEIFSVGGTGLEPVLSDEDLDAFRTLAGNNIESFLGDSSALLKYLHRRGIQRMVVQALATGELTASPGAATSSG